MEDGPFEKFHRDGSLWVRGHRKDGVEHGAFEFFRKDGTLMRSGSFDHGRQVGAWTTYDQDGKPYKTTVMKPAPKG